MGSTVSIAIGLAMTLVVFLFLPEYSARVDAEFAPLLRMLGVTVLLASPRWPASMANCAAWPGAAGPMGRWCCSWSRSRCWRSRAADFTGIVPHEAVGSIRACFRFPSVLLCGLCCHARFAAAAGAGRRWRTTSGMSRRWPRPNSRVASRRQRASAAPSTIWSTEFRRLGLQPGNGDSWVQTVPIVEITAGRDASPAPRRPPARLPRRHGDPHAPGGTGGRARGQPAGLRRPWHRRARVRLERLCRPGHARQDGRGADQRAGLRDRRRRRCSAAGRSPTTGAGPTSSRRRRARARPAC